MSGHTLVHGKWVNGYQIFYDASAHRNRWLKALGPSVNTFELVRGAPLSGPAGSDTYWGTGTMKESGAGSTTITAPVAAGVIARIATAANEYDGANIQASGAPFTTTSGKPFYFGAKVKINHATSTDLYIGLCGTRTELLKASAAHGLHASTKYHAGFWKLDGGTTIKYGAESSGNISSASASSAMDTSAHIYEMYWDGSILKFYIDGSVQSSTVSAASYIGTTALRPSICFRNGNAAVRQCDIYWWRAIQIGQ